MKKQVEYLQRLFYDLRTDFGGVYLIVKYSDRTRIGKRGFKEDEMKQGLVLHYDLPGAFSPEARVQFVRNDIRKEPAASPETDARHGDARQVVSLSSFRKRKT